MQKTKCQNNNAVVKNKSKQDQKKYYVGKYGPNNHSRKSKDTGMSQEVDVDEEEEIKISEYDMEKGLENMRSWKKYSRCNRPSSEHKGSKENRCVFKPLKEEQLEDYYKELKTRAKGKKKKSKSPKRDR